MAYQVMSRVILQEPISPWSIAPLIVHPVLLFLFAICRVSAAMRKPKKLRRPCEHPGNLVVKAGWRCLFVWCSVVCSVVWAGACTVVSSLVTLLCDACWLGSFAVSCSELPGRSDALHIVTRSHGHIWFFGVWNGGHVGSPWQSHSQGCMSIPAAPGIPATTRPFKSVDRRRCTQESTALKLRCLRQSSKNSQDSSTKALLALCFVLFSCGTACLTPRPSVHVPCCWHFRAGTVSLLKTHLPVLEASSTECVAILVVLCIRN